jgi:hypothetical protein
LVAAHVLASITTASTDTKAASTSSMEAAAIAPMLSGLEDVLTVAPAVRLRVADPGDEPVGAAASLSVRVNWRPRMSRR